MSYICPHGCGSRRFVLLAAVREVRRFLWFWWQPIVMFDGACRQCGGAVIVMRDAVTLQPGMGAAAAPRPPAPAAPTPAGVAPPPPKPEPQWPVSDQDLNPPPEDRRA